MLEWNKCSKNVYLQSPTYNLFQTDLLYNGRRTTRLNSGQGHYGSWVFLNVIHCSIQLFFTSIGKRMHSQMCHHTHIPSTTSSNPTPHFWKYHYTTTSILVRVRNITHSVMENSHETSAEAPSRIFFCRSSMSILMLMPLSLSFYRSLNHSRSAILE